MYFFALFIELLIIVLLLDSVIVFFKTKDKEKKKKRKNIIIWLFISLVIVIFLAPSKKSYYKDRLAEMHKTAFEYLIGKKYTYKINQELGGEVETLSGTNDNMWVAYFPKEDVTIVENKQSGIIISQKRGRNPQ